MTLMPHSRTAAPGTAEMGWDMMLYLAAVLLQWLQCPHLISALNHRGQRLRCLKTSQQEQIGLKTGNLEKGLPEPCKPTNTLPKRLYGILFVGFQDHERLQSSHIPRTISLGKNYQQELDLMSRSHCPSHSTRGIFVYTYNWFLCHLVTATVHLGWHLQQFMAMDILKKIKWSYSQQFQFPFSSLQTVNKKHA